MNNHDEPEYNVSRRRFLAGLAAGGLGLALPWKFGEAFAGDGQRSGTVMPTGVALPNGKMPVNAMQNFRFDQGTDKGVPYCAYSFDSVNGLGVDYKTEVRGDPGKITYTVSGLPLQHMYKNTKREDRTQSYFRTAIAIDPRSYFNSTDNEIKKANHFITATGAFLYASRIIMYPTFIARENAIPKNTDGLGVYAQNTTTGYNYDVSLMCYSDDSLFFSEIIEQRPSYKPRREEYLIRISSLLDTWRIRHSDDFFVPACLVPDKSCTISLHYTSKGQIVDAPAFAKKSIMIRES